MLTQLTERVRSTAVEAFQAAPSKRGEPERDPVQTFNSIIMRALKRGGCSGAWAFAALAAIGAPTCLRLYQAPEGPPNAVFGGAPLIQG